MIPHPTRLPRARHARGPGDDEEKLATRAFSVCRARGEYSKVHRLDTTRRISQYTTTDPAEDFDHTSVADDATFRGINRRFDAWRRCDARVDVDD